MKDEKKAKRKRTNGFPVGEILTVIVLIVLICMIISRRGLVRGPEPEYEGKVEDDDLYIVILDSEQCYFMDEGIDNGIRMALDQLKKDIKKPVRITVQDDGGDYAKGIAIAQELAKDPSVDMVISFQDFECIGAEIPFFEEAKKPFIVTMGCIDSDLEKDYEYLLADCMSAKAIGEQIGKFLMENNARNIAFCHSDTPFELAETRGIQTAIQGAEEVRIVLTQTGPYQESEYDRFLKKIDHMQIDSVVAVFYEDEDYLRLLRRLCEENKKLTLVGDYGLDSDRVRREYGKYLEGVYVVPNYPFEKSEKLDAFTKQYEETTETEITTAAMQYYDLIRMLGIYWYVTDGDRESIMKRLKSPGGFLGVAGRICFDENGSLITKECPVYSFRDSELRIDTP